MLQNFRRCSEREANIRTAYKREIIERVSDAVRTVCLQERGCLLQGISFGTPRRIDIDRIPVLPYADAAGKP